MMPLKVFDLCQSFPSIAHLLASINYSQVFRLMISLDMIIRNKSWPPNVNEFLMSSGCLDKVEDLIKLTTMGSCWNTIIATDASNGFCCSSTIKNRQLSIPLLKDQNENI